MPPHGYHSRVAVLPEIDIPGVLIRCCCAAILALISVGALYQGVDAASDDTPSESTTGASNGGVATATNGNSVITIGEITTGENTGNSIETGDISGSAEIYGGEIGSPTDVDLLVDSGPQLADASGGDGGQATGADPAQVDVNIDNTDKNINDNKSKAISTINNRPEASASVSVAGLRRRSLTAAV